jgi:hypothetical protein
MSCPFFFQQSQKRGALLCGKSFGYNAEAFDLLYEIIVFCINLSAPLL